MAWDVCKFSQVLKASHKYNKNFIGKKREHIMSPCSLLFMYLLNNARNDQQRDENKKY